MKRNIMIFILTLFLILPIGTNIRAEESNLFRENLKKDILVLKNELPMKHCNIAHTISRDQFENSLEQLYNKADTMDVDQIYLEMVKDVAAIGDGHTNMSFSKEIYDQFEFLPISIYFFSDGVFTIATKKGYEDLIGKQIVKVNGIDIKQIFERVKPLIAHENDYWVKYNFSNFFCCYNVLKYLGITSSKTIKLTVTDGNCSYEQNLPLISFKDMNRKDDWRTFYNQFSISPSIAEKNKKLNYWYEYLEQYHAIYFQYNACMESPDQTMKEFARNLFSKVKKEKISNIIIDLRYNSGGNSGLFSKNIFPKLRKKSNINVFFITGRKTFSSGLFAVRELTSLPNSISFGEPTGNSPNHYGQTSFLKLKNTNTTVTFSTKYWNIFPDNHVNTYIPDVLVPIDSKSLFQGEDKVTQKIFEYIKNQ